MKRQTLAIAIACAVCAVGAWWMGLFAQVQLRLSDVYFVEAPVSDKLVIVGLDDASFSEYGRTPAEWSRQVYADMVRVLSENGARVIAFDLLFAESTPEDASFAQALVEARQTYRTRIVLAGAGVQTATTSHTQRALLYPNALLPIEPLRNLADYVGYVNVFTDADSRIRQQASLVQIEESLGLSFSIATYLAYLRIPSQAASQVILPEGEYLAVTPGRKLWVDERGLWRQNYFGGAHKPEHSTFTVLSAREVVKGNIPTGSVQDKIVLIGIINSTGAVDQYLVPSSASGNPMTGVEIQANALETLLQNKPLQTLHHPLEGIIVALLALGASILYARAKVARKFLIAVFIGGAWVIGAFLLFGTNQLVLPLFYPLLAITLPLPVLILVESNEEFRKRLEIETQQKALEEEKRHLEALNEREQAEKRALEDLNKLKTHMIRMASHDLKNPLGRILGYAELLAMDLTDPLQVRFIDNIKQASDEMTLLITDILSLEQLRSTELEREKLVFNHVVNDMVVRHEADFYRKSQFFSADITDETLYVFGDIRQLSQAISNLIGNASKYTPNEGHIRIRLKQAGHFAHLAIEDTGYGIPESAVPNLFTDFYRVKTAETAKISGTGLGLSLVKSVVEAHHGRVWVESVQGQGSTFFIELPLVEADQPHTQNGTES